MSKNKLDEIFSSLAASNEAPVVDVNEPVENTPVVESQEENQELEIENQDPLNEVVDPAVEVPVEKPTEQSSEDEIFSEWDTEEVETNEIKKETVFDFSEISKDLEVGEVKTKEDLVSKVKEKITTLEQKINDLSKSVVPDNIPDVLKDAINLAKEGGDYLSYLRVNSINYDAINDIDLVANSVASYFEENGVVNEEKLDSYLDSMSDEQLRIEAAKIRNSIKVQNQMKIDELKRNATEKKEKFLSGMKKAIDEFSEVDGFKVIESHKDSLWKSFLNDTVIKDLFYNERGEFDYVKAREAVYRAKYGKKMNEFLKTKTRNETKKEIINSMSSIEIERPSSAPKVETDKQELSAIDKMILQLRGNKINKE